MTAAFDLLALAAELNGEPRAPSIDAGAPDRGALVVPVREHTRRIRPRVRTAATSAPRATNAPTTAPAEAVEPTPPPFVPTKAQRAQARQRDYERLEPIALRLALSVGAAGFTADNLRRAAVREGVITGEEGKGKHADQQRALSWFGPFLTSLARRGLIAPLTYPDGAKVKRASDRPEAHANSHVVYTLPAFSRR